MGKVTRIPHTTGRVDLPVTYSWSDRRRYGIDPQVVGETVARIEAEEGFCTPGRLVEEARPVDSPLHPAIEWDVEKAAFAYQKAQARALINNLRVTKLVDGHEVKAPAYISVGHIKASKDRGTGYRSIPVVTADEVWREEAAQDVLARLLAFRHRYGSIGVFAPVWDAIDDLADLDPEDFVEPQEMAATDKGE